MGLTLTVSIRSLPTCLGSDVRSSVDGINPPSALKSERPSECRNCGAPLTGRFCASCGQKVAERSTSLLGFLRESLSEVFEFRSRSFITFIHLLFKPGAPTAAYFQGQRVRYAQPAQVYLVAAALFFLVNSFNPFVELSDENKVESRLGAMRTGQQLSQARIDSLQQAGVSLPLFRERFKSRVTESLPQFMIGSVVAFGFIIWAFHPRRPALQHFVFSLHWTGFFLILMALERTFLIPWQDAAWIRIVLNAAVFIHLILSLRRVYEYGYFRSILTGILLYVFFNAILAAWVLSVGFYAINAVA